MTISNGAAMNVLVVGAGMYVCGRGTATFGTVMPTLAQAQRQGLVGDILVASTSQESAVDLLQRVRMLDSLLGGATRVRAYPMEGNDSLAYQQAIQELPRPGCAIVVTPDHTHASVGADLIAAGLHLLVVKPLTATVAEARQLIELAEHHNVYGAVEFHKRFDESNLLLRHHVASGALGELRYVTVEYSQRRSVQKLFASWLQRTNIFQYLGVHYVDIIHFATGATPNRVMAIGQPARPQNARGHTYDSVQAVVHWQHGPRSEEFTSTITANWIDPTTTTAMSDQKINVVGSLGRYQADQKERGVQLVTEKGGVEEINPYFTQIYPGGDGVMGVHGYGPASISRFLRDAQDLVEGRCQRRDLLTIRPSFQQALPSTAVVEGVNRSLELGGEWVPIGQVGRP